MKSEFAPQIGDVVVLRRASRHLAFLSQDSSYPWSLLMVPPPPPQPWARWCGSKVLPGSPSPASDATAMAKNSSVPRHLAPSLVLKPQDLVQRPMGRLQGRLRSEGARAKSLKSELRLLEVSPSPLRSQNFWKSQSLLPTPHI